MAYFVIARDDNDDDTKGPYSLMEPGDTGKSFGNLTTAIAYARAVHPSREPRVLKEHAAGVLSHLSCVECRLRVLETVSDLGNHRFPNPFGAAMRVDTEAGHAVYLTHEGDKDWICQLDREV